MPELPEVETVVRSLQPILPGRRIVGLKALWPRSLHEISARQLINKIKFESIDRLERRAKLVLLFLNSGACLAIHLRMTGRLYPTTSEKLKYINTFHISFWIEFQDGDYLVFEDQRRFGRLYYFANTGDLDKYLQKYGPEPLDDDFKVKDFYQSLQRHKRQLKPLLLDQAFLAGLGNIYVDEALWLAQLHPQSLSHQVDQSAAQKLYKSIRQVLNRSIESNGTTFMNFKFLGGQAGGYTDELLVFRQQGQACKRCGTIILRIKVAQRSTHLCPQCQSID